MQRRHRIFLNPATEEVAHHEVGSIPQMFDETGDVAKIVTVVCIPHHHVFAARSRNPAHQRIAVSLGLHIYNPRPSRPAISTELSVLPLSAITTSPAIFASRNARCALRMQISSVSASFKQGITTDTSIVFTSSTGNSAV